MKANKIQNYLCDVILSQQSFWRNSNDITSPTHLTDIEEECFAQLGNLIQDSDREEFENKLKDLYWFIRKFDEHGTNNFPNIIYLPRDVEYPQVPDVWCEREASEDNVEYVKTNIIIDWLEENLPSYWSQKIVSTDSFIEDFKDFVKENKL